MDILANLSLNPSISVRTAEKADSTTILVKLWRYELAEIPDILKGLSSSWKQTDAVMRNNQCRADILKRNNYTIL